jgi:hypothetical protein
VLQRVWLAQLWAENSLGVLARSRTVYEEIAYLVGRNDVARVLAVLPLCFAQPIKNHVDAYLKVWSYIRPHASGADTSVFFRLLQERAPGLNQHLYHLVLRHSLWYLFNSRLFLANTCPDRLWVLHHDAMSLVVFDRDGLAIQPWARFAAELAVMSDPTAMAARSEDGLVILRVGDELFWNPKLAGLPGSEQLEHRLRDAGFNLQVLPRARQARA